MVRERYVSNFEKCPRGFRVEPTYLDVGTCPSSFKQQVTKSCLHSCISAPRTLNLQTSSFHYLFTLLTQASHSQAEHSLALATYLGTQHETLALSNTILRVHSRTLHSRCWRRHLSTSTRSSFLLETHLPSRLPRQYPPASPSISFSSLLLLL